MVIVRETHGAERSLVAYEFATGETSELVPLGYDEDPAVSPDGSAVVVVRANGPQRDPGTREWLAESGSHLVLIDLVDGDEQVLTDTASRQQVRTPQWNREEGWVYYLRWRAGRPDWLTRVLPETGEVERVPHGRGISQFVLEPDGRHAWVYTPWRWPDAPTRGGAWRLDLTTGAVKLHALQMYVGGELAWTPAGDWIAITQNVESGSVSVAPWPDGWSPPPNAGWPAGHLYPKKDQWPRFVTTFGDLGWEPDGSHVVLASRRGVVEDRRMFPTTFDRWYVSLIDRRSGERTDITPSGAADTSFDVWWP